LYRFPRLVLRLAARLPLAAAHRLGSVLGWVIYGISPTYRRHLRENLLQAGYDGPRLRREAIAGAGRMLAELPVVWFRPRERVASLVKRVQGLEAALEARAAGKAVVFLTPHMGCFEIAAQYAAERMPITVLYRPPKIGWLDPVMREGRAHPNLRLAPADVSGVRGVLAALKRGEAAGFLPDQVPGEGEGEWADFFGRKAYTMTLAARLAARDNLLCLLAYARRLPGGEGFEIVLRPLPAPLPGESATRRVNRALEALVRECPGQYLWGYNRYKIPKGARPPP
jgi:Kdo2-lipid IVA lauroyltransferase/acyltransferase